LSAVLQEHLMSSPPPAGPAAVRLRGVTKRFGDLVALDALDLTVPTGACFGLLGPNGAGKSTLLALVTGAAVATSGEVEVLGELMPGAHREVLARTGLVPQLDNLDGELTCRENLDVYARLYGVPRDRRAAAVDDALALARLTDRDDAFVEELSGGMRRRLLIARGLVHTPDLVLLDEPTVGLDPQVRQELWSAIEKIRATGATTVLTTHYIEEAERLCDVVAVVSHGRLVELGSPTDLVTRHVGSEVVVEVHGDADRQGRVRAAADDRGVRHRAAGTSVVLFTDDSHALDGGDGLMAGDLDHRTRRPGNLEDVFVTLTGETL